MTKVILSIDEGTTNAKALLIDENGKIVSSASHPVPIEYPCSGWAQQRPDDIWNSTARAISDCLLLTPNAKIIAIGISNQRESVLIWDRVSGEPLGPVITWQCRRTSKECSDFKASGYEDEVIRKTGLPIDPLFPATKLKWLCDQFGRNKDICAGTIDTWLMWKLSGEKIHKTDRSNASRTQLFNLESLQWDDQLCKLFTIDKHILPIVEDSSTQFGITGSIDILPSGIPISGAIGDSHAALFGHGAFDAGDSKITFGTGSSVMSTLSKLIKPPIGLTTTIAWSLDGRPTYALEGNILASASILPWVAEILGVKSVADLLQLAQSAENSANISLVPAHVGLGSPHWDSEARGLINGLSFDSKPKHIARAAANSIGLQVWDVIKIMKEATNDGLGDLFIDGGPSKNDFLMQLTSDLLLDNLIRDEETEASAKGAGYLAGLAVGFWDNLESLRTLANKRHMIQPRINEKERSACIVNWDRAVKRARSD